MRLNHLAIGFAFCLAGGAANANLLSNGSFELPAIPSGENLSITGGGTATEDSWDWNYITGVIAGGVTGAFNGSSLPTGYDGSQYAYLQGTSSSLTQSFTLAMASNVNVTWLYAGRPDLTLGFDGNTTYDVNAGSLSFTGTTTSGTDFQSASLTGVLAAGTYSVTFTNDSPDGDHTMYLDDVVLTASAVPEPGSLALLGLGFAALLLWRYRPVLTDGGRKRFVVV